MNEIGASALALLALVVACAPRRWALLGMVAGALCLTNGQSLDLFGLTMYPMRCLELVGFIRVMVRNEFSTSMVNGIDRALIGVYAYTTAIFLLRTALGGGTAASIGQISTLGKVGALVDALLCYYTFRGLVGGVGDLIWFLRGLVLLLGPYVALVSMERLTGHNPFAVVGGLATIWIDGSRSRPSGSFGHPSLLGTFGASFVPLYLALALTRANVARALTGLACCVSIVLLANSGGPVMVVALGVGAWMLWVVRRQMRVVRWSMLGMFVLLALVMKVPVWYLPQKVSSLTGGDGRHRSVLMNQAMEHIDQWWLAGMALDRTRDWFHYQLEGAADLTNAYLVFAFDAGLPAVALFIFLLVRAFQGLGAALATARASSQGGRAAEVLLWGLGGVLAGHVGNFFSITYWDQTYTIWFLQIAMVSGVLRAGVERRAEPVPTAVSAWWAGGARGLGDDRTIDAQTDMTPAPPVGELAGPSMRRADLNRLSVPSGGER